MSSPEAGGSSVQTMYYLSIVCARRAIFIANPYFIPDEVATETLVEARARGVDVRIMVSGIRNDNWWARKNSVRLYGRLLEAGIQVLEYNRSMLHHKFMVVDGTWVTIGTTNFDNRSFAHNEESNVCVYDRDVASTVEQIFRNDVPACGVVTLAAWRGRSWAARAAEAVAALLEDQV
jgi:cardiolipin synthase